jgi:hypothetical protein
MRANGSHHKKIGSLKVFLRFDISYCKPIEKVESTWNEFGMGIASDHAKKGNIRTMDSDSKEVKYLPK